MRKRLTLFLLVLAVGFAGGGSPVVEARKGASGGNLVVNGDFEKGEILPESWEPTKEKDLTDEMIKQAIGLEKVPGHGRAICLVMTKEIGERQGLGIKSDWIMVDGTKGYEISVKAWTDGPTPKVFCEGYSSREEPCRMSYRAMLNPNMKPRQWTSASREFPEEAARDRFKQVQWLRIKLYGYGCAGTVMFDNVTLRSKGD